MNLCYTPDKQLYALCSGHARQTMFVFVIKYLPAPGTTTKKYNCSIPSTTILQQHSMKVKVTLLTFMGLYTLPSVFSIKM